jgi:hypothetical protein
MLEGEKVYNDDLIVGPMIMTVFGAICSLIVFLLGWFVYGSIAGGLAIMLICMVYGAITVLALIPLVGVFLQGYAILFVAWPALSEIMMIEASWLTFLIFVIYILIGLCYTGVTTLMAMNR